MPKLLVPNIDCPSSFESEKTLGTLVIVSNLEIIIDRKSGLNLTINYLELGNKTVFGNKLY